MIDFTNLVGNFFLSRITDGDFKQFGTNLANSLNIQKIIQPNLSAEVAKGGTTGLAAEFAPFIHTFAAIVVIAI